MNIEYLSSSPAIGRHREWEKLVGELFGAVEMSMPYAEAFSWKIRRAPLGELELDEVVSDFEIARRTCSHIARDRREFFSLIFLRSGKLHIEQCGRECNLLPSMFALIDLNQPYLYTHNQRTDVLCVKIPSDTLSSTLKDPYRYGATARTGQKGTGRITAEFLSSFFDQLSELPEDLACRYSSRIVDLVSIFLETADSDVSTDHAAVRSTVYGRCVAFIENHLAELELGPERIAKANGISVRYLHKIFQGSGESVGEFVRRARLNRSYADLTDVSKRKVPIKEIAFRGGFRSQAHFANVIKKSYGAPPTGLRQIALTRHQNKI